MITDNVSFIISKIVYSNFSLLINQNKIKLLNLIYS